MRAIGSLISLCCLCATAAAQPVTLDVARAVAESNAHIPGQALVRVALKDGAASSFLSFTTRHLNSKVDIRVNGRVVVSPVIRDPIMGGVVLITAASMAEARALASELLAGGRLEVELAKD